MKLLLFISLLLISFVSANAALRAAEPRQVTEAKQPNILFLFADDWGRYASIYSEVNGKGGINDVVRTPNFDKFAKQGVLFRHAHVNAPSCTPCRSALLSGQYFWRTGRGAILQGAVWDESIPSYPLLLRDAGYHIGKTYKVWSPGTPADAPYGGQKYSFQKAGGRFNQFSENVTQLIASGKAPDDSKEELYGEIRSNFADFLAARGTGKPFCYWFGPTNVHRPWTKGSGKKLWNIDPDTLQGKMPPYLPDVPEVREDLADYFGEIAAWDAGIGVILAELDKTGEREKARDALRELQELSKTSYVPSVASAIVYEGLMEKDFAIEALNRACENRETNLILIKVWPHFDNLRDDPRFQEIDSAPFLG